MNALIWAIGATIVVSSISLIGIVTLILKEQFLEKVILLFVGFSAGALIGGAFLHLIPEALEGYSKENVFLYVLIGFSLFFILERVIKWRHCHEKIGECKVHSFTYLNLVGDGLHNFIDGLVIVAAFSVDIKLGVTTTIAVITHEIPQEISDFGVLIYGGLSKTKALFLNFLSALTAILGAIIGYFISTKIDNFSEILLAFTAGGFIYIASSDLIPELHKETKTNKAILSFVFFLLGLLFMYLVKMFME